MLPKITSWTSPIARIVDSGEAMSVLRRFRRRQHSLLAEGDSVLVALWDSEKNGDLKPSDVTLRSIHACGGAVRSPMLVWRNSELSVL